MNILTLDEGNDFCQLLEMKVEVSKLDGDPNNDYVPFCDMRFGDEVKVLHGDTVILSGCVSSKDIPGAPEC